LSIEDGEGGVGESAGELLALQDRISECRRCPRLVAWRERVAEEKRASFAEEEYWGRPVPSFGDPGARLLVVGLAPAAHGANRTGRMFTGDRSGDWLFRALHRAGFASQPGATHAGDGLTLRDTWITATVHCAPPDNRPTSTERRHCRSWLEAELDLVAPQVEVVVCLGGYAWNQMLRVLKARGWGVPVPRPKFGHGAEVGVPRPPGGPDAHETGDGNGDDSRTEAPIAVVGSYHPSQQNTFTGTLTEEMFDAVWTRARELLER
jgi:uracil-DNA glycosylase family 4